MVKRRYPKTVPKLGMEFVNGVCTSVTPYNCYCPEAAERKGYNPIIEQGWDKSLHSRTHHVLTSTGTTVIYIVLQLFKLA